VDVAAREVARAASAEAEDASSGTGISAWYFCVLAAYVHADVPSSQLERRAIATRARRVVRLSRLEILEPLVACARALGSRAGRRRALGDPTKRASGAEDSERASRATLTRVWNLTSLMLRACDTTQARRVFARRCVARAANVLGFAAGGGASGEDGFRVADVETDAEFETDAERKGAKPETSGPPDVPGSFRDDDEPLEVLRAISIKAPSPYGLFAPDSISSREAPGTTPPRLSFGAFQKMFDFAFLRALVKVAAEPGAGTCGADARRALCHVSWRWETMSYAVCVCALERLDKVDRPDDVSGALRLCEALLRIDDARAKVRCGFVLEGRRFKHPDAIPDSDEGPAAEGVVPPYLRLAISTATDLRMEDFPSGVIEQAAFEACAAPKRFLITRFLVKGGEEDGDFGDRCFSALAAQAEDFGYVVGAFGDEAEDMDAVHVAREDEEEVGAMHGAEDETERGGDGFTAAAAPPPRDDSLDHPSVVLERVERLFARTRNGKSRG